jgi:choloylglycine hydrolase
MKTFTLNKLTIAAMAIVSIVGIGQTANACSRITLDTPHGVSTVRSLDWGQQLGNVTQVNPIGIKRVSTETPNYENNMSWTTQYHSVAQMEYEVFGGVTSDAINIKGLAASLLYLADSAPFIADYQDTGAPAVSLMDVIAYITETYATTEEAVTAFNNNEWQIAWKDGLHGTQHGLHISIHDRAGDIALLQLNEGGKMILHRGDVASDLRVMANAPLQQEHRAYVAEVDLSDLSAKDVPTSISSLDRNLRGLFHTSHVKFAEDKSWAQTRGKLLSTFNAGNLVPQDLVDPVNGETYASWTQFVYNHENGDFLFTNYDTREQIGYKFSDTLKYTETVCGDTVKQASEGKSTVTFSTCNN